MSELHEGPDGITYSISDLDEAAAIEQVVHTVLHDLLGECPETGDTSACWEIAVALVAEGWVRGTTPKGTVAAPAVDGE